MFCFLGLEEMLWLGKFTVDLKTSRLADLQGSFGRAVAAFELHLCGLQLLNFRRFTSGADRGILHALHHGNVDFDLQSCCCTRRSMSFAIVDQGRCTPADVLASLRVSCRHERTFARDFPSAGFLL